MPRIKYLKCSQAEKLMYELSDLIGLDVKARIGVVVSRGARARAYARIYGLSSAIQVAHSLPPLYTIEFICEKAMKLNIEALTEVGIHELLHIPQTQKGGLRPHGDKVNSRITRKLLKNVDREFEKSFYEAIERCCSSCC